MKKNFLKATALAALLFALPASAQHAHHGGGPKSIKAPVWTAYPILIAGGGYSRTGTQIHPFNLHAMVGTSYASFYGQGKDALAQATNDLKVDQDGTVRVKSGKQGGYYLVQVFGHGPQGEETTASAFKYFSNPGPAPRNLLAAVRPGFEIVPNILPREHAHYREGETWNFRVRGNGEAVPYAKVVMETSNGTQRTFTGDANGLVAVTFPTDFIDIPKDQWRHGRPPASKFVLAVRHEGLLATFNGGYRLGAYGDKDLMAGIGFAVVGMAVAAPIVFRRKKKKGG